MEKAGGKTAAPLSDKQKIAIAKIRAEYGARRKELLLDRKSVV